MTDFVQWLYVFALMVVLDFLWARYILALRDNQHVKGGVYAGTLYMLGGIVTVSFVFSPILLVPAGIGAFVGTYIGSKLGRRA